MIKCLVVYQRARARSHIILDPTCDPTEPAFGVDYKPGGRGSKGHRRIA